MVKFYAAATALGWIGIVLSPAGVRRITLPQPSREATMALLFSAGGATSIETEEIGDLPERLARYALSGEWEFDDKLDLVQASPFLRTVWRAARSIPKGETRSYAWLAQEAGNPKAARAVGTAMRLNPLPIIIPCHRVVGSSGQLRGYAGGLELKRRLLQLEGCYQSR